MKRRFNNPARLMLEIFVFALICGTGSAFAACWAGSDIGGGQCRDFLTSGTSWSVPNDWNDSNNRIETIGGGGESGSELDGGGAGGGGGYSSTENINLPEGTSVTYAIGSGGVAGTPGNSTNGGNTYFCNSTSNCASLAGTAVVVGAEGGKTISSASIGGAGGAAANGKAVGDNPLKFSGGKGGNGGPSNNDGGGGGGGAGGPDNDGTGATGRGQAVTAMTTLLPEEAGQEET